MHDPTKHHPTHANSRTHRQHILLRVHFDRVGSACLLWDDERVDDERRRLWRQPRCQHATRLDATRGVAARKAQEVLKAGAEGRWLESDIAAQSSKSPESGCESLVVGERVLRRKTLEHLKAGGEGWWLLSGVTAQKS
eukprot:254473-Chlamydomonas_euryale.AAC.1